MIKKMYQDDPYMNFEIIKKESALCANLFLWSNEILEYKENAAMRSKIGIKELDEKISNLEQKKLISNEIDSKDNMSIFKKFK